MRISLTILASGSGGNSMVVSSGDQTVLIDAGLSARQIEKRLDLIGCQIQDVTALIVTHEHADHIAGVSTLADKRNIPVFGTAGTLSALRPIHRSLYRPVDNNGVFTIGSLSVRSFTIPHDARDPVGYIISTQGIHLGIVTDLGHFSRRHAELLRICTWIVLECNHDPVMLEQGPYPRFLKDRIRGDRGHLSNEQASRALELTATSRLRGLILAHMSEKNNTRERAERAVLRSLRSIETGITTIATARQGKPVGPFDLSLS